MRASVHRALRYVVAVALVAFVLLAYASNQIFDEDEFAGLVSSSLDDPDVPDLLATKAVAVAVDASDADRALADALPDEVALVASPAIELAKPSVADAGAALLGVERVQVSVERAVRSAHRQTVRAVLADEEATVVLNTRPILTVVAEEIGGDAGARAVVGLNLPESATQIELGSNSSGVWGTLRLFPALSGGGFVILLAALVGYFATAARGTRLDAARRLGRAILGAGAFVLVLGALSIGVAAVMIEAAFSPGEEITFTKISVGGVSSEGSLALAEELLGPLLALGRRTIINGLALIGVAHLFGDSEAATALRKSVRTREAAPLRAVIRRELPGNVRRVRRFVWLALAIMLIGWPSGELRYVLTVVGLAGVVLLLIGLYVSERELPRNLLALAALDGIPAGDSTDRTPRATLARRRLAVLATIGLIAWPSYGAGALTWLVVPVALAMAASHQWEGADAASEEPVLHVGADTGERSMVRWAVFVVVGVAAVVGLVLATGSTNPASADALDRILPDRCNGHADLCDRKLDEVAFAGTHNSMSAASLGWELANHDGAIPEQLDAGIRALLIDVQRWNAPDDLDDFASDPDALAIVRASLAGAEAPEDGLWMCHKLCQLGGTPFQDFVADLRAFLDTNPDEVVIVVIQDEAPAVGIVAALEAGGLDELALRHAVGTPWPTLGEMIEANTRLVFLAENDVPPNVDWYELAFEGNVSETGFAYAVVGDFECAPNRGGNDGELFMINHWVETGLPVPEGAELVNSSAVLEDRIDECERVRGRQPGIIAVNFWERGDLFEVVEKLNGPKHDD